MPCLIVDGVVLSEGPSVNLWLADAAPESHLAPAASTLARYQVIDTYNFIGTDIHAGVFGLLWGKFYEPAVSQRPPTHGSIDRSHAALSASRAPRFLPTRALPPPPLPPQFEALKPFAIKKLTGKLAYVEKSFLLGGARAYLTGDSFSIAVSLRVPTPRPHSARLERVPSASRVRSLCSLRSPQDAYLYICLSWLPTFGIKLEELNPAVAAWQKKVAELDFVVAAHAAMAAASPVKA